MAGDTERRRPRAWLILAGIVALIAVVLVANTILVDRKTRAAAPRDGGRLIDTDVVQANVKVEGGGPPIVMIHGFGAALDWWDAIALELAKDHRVIRLDLIGHGGTAAPASRATASKGRPLLSLLFSTSSPQARSLSSVIPWAARSRTPWRSRGPNLLTA
jgi:pimeloyl-ACP methyl ester carboxylesterase